MVGPDRWTYLVGDLDAERHADQIIAAATAFQKTENGIVPWKERCLARTAQLWLIRDQEQAVGAAITEIYDTPKGLTLSLIHI